MAKIKKITVTNLKAVSALTADFNGCTAIITGGNNKGKSSFLRSFPDRIRGIKTDLILKSGEKEGSAEIELTTGERLTWQFDGKGKEKLTFITEKNIPTSLTKDLCKTYFPPVFDVDAFLQDSPAKQKATLQKISGIDFTDLDKEYKGAYEQRTWANRVLAEAKAKRTNIEPSVGMEPISVEELAAELSKAEQHNAGVLRIQDGRASRIEQVEDLKAQVIKLEEQITELRNKGKAVQEEITKADEWLKENQPVDDTAIRTKISSAEETNKEIRANIAAAESIKKCEQAEKDAAEADAEVKRLEELKADTLKHSMLPDGFGFDEDGITYNGLPFNREQLSSSAIYIAALKLAAISLGEVKTLHFDASFLDKNSLAEIETWANANDLQLLIERPDWDCGEIRYEIVQPVENGKPVQGTLITPIPEGVIVEQV